MKIELCAATIEAIQLAKELNIDRIELCQNLEQGGMTPSPGMIDYAIAFGIETHVLIRPRPGGFKYDQNEIEIMIRDITECQELGASGIVIGVLDEFGMINEEAISKMVEKAGEMEVTFHRAFDDTYNFEKSIDTLVDLGVKRILSSGLGSNVELGLENIKSMVKYANNRIEIMAGGGVNANNIERLIKEARPHAIHFSGTKKVILDENSFFSETILQVQREKVEKLIEMAHSFNSMS